MRAARPPSNKGPGSFPAWQKALVVVLYTAALVRWHAYLRRPLHDTAVLEGLASLNKSSPAKLTNSPAPPALPPVPSPEKNPKGTPSQATEAPLPTFPASLSGESNVTGSKRLFFFPSTYNATWRMGLLRMGAVNFVLNSEQFESEGRKGDVARGQRAYLMYRLWQKSENGDGANFHGQAADLARNKGIGLYKFPPELLDQLPRLPPPLSFETCAVVGNSGELLQGALGEEIDAHGMIIRMNAAPIKGFEKHVGNKTTFSFLNHVHFRKLALGQRPRAISFAADKGKLVLFESTVYQAYYWLYANLVERFPPQQLALVIVSPDFMSAAYELWRRMTLLVGYEEQAFFKHRKPTSGWFAMVFAAQICEQVDLYGFEAYKRTASKPVKYHYFDDVQGFTNVHSFELTVKVFRRLQSMGFNIRMAHPEHGISTQ